MKNRIREVRKSKGLTLAKLAEKLDTQASTIRRFEAGIRNVSLNWLERIAKALGVRPSDLLIEGAPNKGSPENLLWEIIPVVIGLARDHPKLDVSTLTNIAKALHRSMSAGKIAAKPRILQSEAERLIEYESAKTG